MAHYTMVKNTTFNGIRLPSIAVYNSETKQLQVVREFGYEDYRNRLS
jgi:carboxynorspermidine decarboxylase